jgi:hypothetical protein
MIRILLGTLCLFIAFAVQASCGSLATLHNEKFYLDIGDYCDGDMMMITFAIADENGKFGKSKQFPFNKECSLTKNGFKCRSGGHTPLAGATYKKIYFGRSQYVNDGCDSSLPPYSEPGQKYICIKGCAKPTVPEFLFGDDGSC